MVFISIQKTANCENPGAEETKPRYICFYLTKLQSTTTQNIMFTDTVN